MREKYKLVNTIVLQVNIFIWKLNYIRKGKDKVIC